ncbi:hypothetical protein [Nocardioides pakistanensis]
MIGHVFTSSGATALALAPGRHHYEYVVLAWFEDQYVVATLDAASMVEPDGPAFWSAGDYFDDLGDAAEEFARIAGLSDVPLLVKQARYAENEVARVNAQSPDVAQTLSRNGNS